MFEAFFLVGQEILYETSKYYVVVNSREFILYLPSEKHSFEMYKWDGKHTEQSGAIIYTLTPKKWVKEGKLQNKV